jgi:hypothetical protein
MAAATAGHPLTVQDGTESGGANVSVTCIVHPRGNGFDIALTAIEQGPQGGSLTISSPQGQGTVTMMPSSGISAAFVGMGGIDFREQAGSNDPTGCTITYDTTQAAASEAWPAISPFQRAHPSPPGASGATSSARMPSRPGRRPCATPRPTSCSSSARSDDSGLVKGPRRLIDRRTREPPRGLVDRVVDATDDPDDGRVARAICGRRRHVGDERT